MYNFNNVNQRFTVSVKGRIENDWTWKKLNTRRNWKGKVEGKAEVKVIDIKRKTALKNNYGVWAVTNRDNNELIGHCGFNILEDTKETELLYAFDPKSWGKGYATEASMAAIKFLSENFKINYVVALVYPNNNRSSNVIKKIGFEYKGIEKHFGVELLYYKLNLDKYPL